VPGDLDFWPGPGPRTLDLPFNGQRVKVGMQICYEIIFSGQVVDRATAPISSSTLQRRLVRRLGPAAASGAGTVARD
jgi:predicted amidohydrolase